MNLKRVQTFVDRDTGKLYLLGDDGRWRVRVMEMKRESGGRYPCLYFETTWEDVSTIESEALEKEAVTDKIIQVSGFGVENTSSTQCNYLLVALTESGKVLLSTGNGIWENVGPQKEDKKEQANESNA